MCDEPYVSPYLRRPVRSYDEILREQARRGDRPRPDSGRDPRDESGSNDDPPTRKRP